MTNPPENRTGMKFTVERNALLNELSLVQGIIEKKSTIPILSNILLEAAGERLDITATDLDVSICCGCKADVETAGSMTVSSRRIFDIVRLLPDDSIIRCSLLENDWVGVKSGKSEYKVVGLPRENFPSIAESPVTGIAIPGTVLKALIQRTMFAITQEESRYALSGAMLMLKPTEIRMVATDGHRLAVVSRDMEFPDVDGEVRALIPRKTLVEIQRMVGDQELLVVFSRDENHLFFTVPGKKLVSRVLAGQFPNYEMVVPRGNDKKAVVPARALADGLRRASIMSDEKLRAVRMAFAPGSLEITASSAEAGEAREVIPAEFDGGNLEIGFNPSYILDFLNVCHSESVNFYVKDSETQGMLSPAGEGDLEYRYVVMPMKF